MFDRELVAALTLCALGLTVAGVAAARPPPVVITIAHVGEPLVTVLAVHIEMPCAMSVRWLARMWGEKWRTGATTTSKIAWTDAVRCGLGMPSLGHRHDRDDLA